MSSLSIDTHWPIAAHMHRCTIHFWWRISILFSKQWVTVKCYSWLEKHGCWITGQLLEIGETGKTCAEEISFRSERHQTRPPGTKDWLALKWGWEQHTALEREFLLLGHQAPLVFYPPPPLTFSLSKKAREAFGSSYISARAMPPISWMNEERKKDHHHLASGTVCRGDDDDDVERPSWHK